MAPLQAQGCKRAVPSSLSCLRAGQFPHAFFPRRIFVRSMLYHSFWSKSVFTDVSGRFRGTRLLVDPVLRAGGGLLQVVLALSEFYWGPFVPWIQWKSLGSHSCALGSKEISVSCEYEPHSTCKTMECYLYLCVSKHTLVLLRFSGKKIIYVELIPNFQEISFPNGISNMPESAQLS